ncbi:MAG: hypothetical protein ACRC62_15750 [Microcoleus sp.]
MVSHSHGEFFVFAIPVFLPNTARTKAGNIKKRSQQRSSAIAS